MELPFKYIVLCIIRILNERNMNLVIEKVRLVNFFNELIKKSYFTMEEKKEIKDNFDFYYEVDSLLNKYYEYFDDDGDKVIFDKEYINQIGSLIEEELNEFDIEIINEVDVVIEGDTDFFDILGIPIKKDLYNFMIDIEKELEDCYDEMSRLECYVGMAEVDINPLINKIKKIKMKKNIMLFNINSLLSYCEQYDLMQYSCNITQKTDSINDIELLIDDDIFDQTDIVDDVCLNSIFTGSDSYISNLKESLMINTLEMSKDAKVNLVKFYLTFLNMLDKEIENSSEDMAIDLMTIKYKLMYTLDSVYDTALFLDKREIDNSGFEEDYKFISNAVYYFAKEVLMYDDDKYKNNQYNTENIMVYINNIIKKLLIKTYYILTKDKKIIDVIRENKLYGVNSISSGLFKDIVDRPKSKIKEV